MKSKNEPLHLRWSRLCKTVPSRDATSGLLRTSIASLDVKSENATKKKQILANISGQVQAGEILCLMGPSGSGKTSLLNCLSGRTTYDLGTITFNGNALTKRLMTKMAYVKQADLFFDHLTVRDQLSYTAMLRLPQSWSRQAKLDEVDRIISLLRLNKVSETTLRLVSGGEKKRTNIGTELLTDPACLLLDEPTSGLDSTSAVALIDLLQTLAGSQKMTIITSIHQPSSKIFFSFDKLMLLAEGHVVYYGTPKHSLEYLRTRNFACPHGYNAGDHWMDLLVRTDDKSSSRQSTVLHSSTSSEESDNSTGILGSDDSVPVYQVLINAWDDEAVAEQIDMAVYANIKQDAEESDGTAVGDEYVSKYNTTWSMQYTVLVHRALKNSRSAIFTSINMVKSVALGLIVGLLYFQMPYSEASIFDRNSFFFFCMTYWVFDAMFNSLMAFPMERDVILKERSSGSYHLSAYFLAKTTSEMPMRMTLPAMYMTISYWMAFVDPSFSHFILTTLISLLSVIAGESLGLMVGATIYDMEKAMASMTVVSLGLMLLGGFFIQNVPFWLRWGKFMSPFKYSFDASRQIVFGKDVPCDGSGVLETLCSGLDTGKASSKDVVDFLGVQGSIGFNALMLIVFCLVPRYIAYRALLAKKEADR